LGVQWNGKAIQALVVVEVHHVERGNRTPQEPHMDMTTLLIILLVVLLVGGGGWYGRGRWYGRP
jgi:hypothetical protein